MNLEIYLEKKNLKFTKHEIHSLFSNMFLKLKIYSLMSFSLLCDECTFVEIEKGKYFYSYLCNALDLDDIQYHKTTAYLCSRSCLWSVSINSQQSQSLVDVQNTSCDDKIFPHKLRSILHHCNVPLDFICITVCSSKSRTNPLYTNLIHSL